MWYNSVQAVDSPQCVGSAGEVKQSIFSRGTLLPFPANDNQRVQPRGLRRAAAARYLGISSSHFDVQRKAGNIPAPKQMLGVVLWDRHDLDRLFDGVSVANENDDYIARTPDREHVAFGGCAATAEIGVLHELRSAISKRARLARERARRTGNYEEFVRSCSVLGRYDADLRVDLANYGRWLPQHLRETFKHYEEGVPLRVIESVAVDRVPSLGDLELADLIYQLDRDVPSRRKKQIDVRLIGGSMGRG
ncbi:hypothetical protein [Bradyrhizobium ottawaense]|uniref:hypothetical protein n=1 Tax=Bradyrhizobium ottawaense TaxID=931866 RepID=UPI003F9FB11F